jgi:transposase-like protein
MSKSVLSAKHFHDEEAAYKWVEARVWPNGPVCPHCNETKRVSKMEGKATRIGLHKCYACRKQFRVTVKTIFEASHVPLHLWLQAFALLTSSKKGISTNQLHRTLGVTLKTAWFMSHRIRLAMAQHGLDPLGGAGKVVEIDETLQGRVEGSPKHVGPGYHFSFRNIVLTLVERGGAARSFHIDSATMGTIIPIVRANVAKDTVVNTDEYSVYGRLGEHFTAHHKVNHNQNEYVRGEVTTNTVEGYFSVFKRGMKGVYQHCSEKHLHRYLAEFDFRYSNRAKLGVDDAMRAERALKGVVGKRLTYRTTDPEARPAS